MNMALSPDEIRAIEARADCLHDAAAVAAALDAMAAAISADLSDDLPVVLCVLTGGIIPTGHLLTRLHFPLEIGYLHATRYRGATRGAAIDWLCEPPLELRDRSVLVVDDILDEGHTLAEIIAYCQAQGARAVRSAVLVEKHHDRRSPDVQADYVGLPVEDRYVFGTGMDYQGYLRNVDGIYAISREDEA